MTFEEIYATRPDKREVGSSGYSRMKHLYDICQELKPRVIVESGTWKGNSAYLFWNSCPGAALICHDISFDNLRWRDCSIVYLERDVETMNYALSERPERALIFFDDHVNQLRRFNWAKAQGFKHMVFDDNVSAEEAKKLKNPPVPTLKMAGIPHEELPFLGRERYNTHLSRVTL